MFETLRLRLREYRNKRLYEPAIRKLEKEGKAVEAERLIAEYLHFRDEIRDERRAMLQEKLFRKARRMHVLVPRYTAISRVLKNAGSIGLACHSQR